MDTIVRLKVNLTELKRIDEKKFNVLMGANGEEEEKVGEIDPFDYSSVMDWIYHILSVFSLKKIIFI